MRIAALLSLLLVLGACAPSVQDLPSPQPFVFSVDYDTLFDATLQTVASTRLSTNFTRASFVVAEADRETGLITAVRLGRTRTSGLGVGVRTGLSFGSGRRGGLTITPGYSSGYSGLNAQTDQAIISIVVRPAGEGAASLAYSSTATDTYDLRIANAFVAEVVQQLLARLGAGASQ